MSGNYPEGVTDADYDSDPEGLDRYVPPADYMIRGQQERIDLEMMKEGICLRCGGDIRQRYREARNNCYCPDGPHGMRGLYLKSKYGSHKSYRHLWESA